jgi:hypothetical protein
MRFEVSYSSGMKHEVNLAGSVVVLGRDPGCDIVLNDTKCSRRHAVVEDTPDGLVVRDSGSANGVFVNERRVDRSFVRPGDTIRLGDVRLRLQAEIGETVIVALDDVELPPAPPPQESLTHPPVAPRPPVAAPPAAVSPAARLPSPPPVVHDPVSQEWPDGAAIPLRADHARQAAAARRLAKRPLTVTVLSGLWLLQGLGAAGAIAFMAWRLRAGAAAWALGMLLCLLVLSGALTMSLGLRALAPWARHLQIAGACLGLLACPFTPAAATTLLYMYRSDVKRSFESAAAGGGAGSAETTFALSIVVMVLVGAVLSGVVAFVVWPVR